MIRPVNIITDNVLKELTRIAKQNSTSISELYITLNSVNTFARDSDSDFIEIFGNDLDEDTSIQTRIWHRYTV